MTLDEDLATAVERRLERLVELSRLRAESAKATRKRLAAARTAGLTKRHRAKLDREGPAGE